MKDNAQTREHATLLKALVSILYTLFADILLGNFMPTKYFFLHHFY